MRPCGLLLLSLLVNVAHASAALGPATATQQQVGQVSGNLAAGQRQHQQGSQQQHASSVSQSSRRTLVPLEDHASDDAAATLQRHSSSSSSGEEEGDAGSQNEGGPPAWLEDYAQWHRANLGAPNATYLVFYCGHLEDKCTGLGDRVRSSMMLLRLANLYRKVLLLSWDYPDPLWRYLMPNKIDWRYTAELKEQLRPLNSSFDCGISLSHNEMLHDVLLEGLHQDEFRQAKVVKTQLVRDFHLHISGEPIMHIDEDRDAYLELGRHLFSFLFTPSEELVQNTDRVESTIYPGAEEGARPSYVAWHWRTGGLVDEPILNRVSTTKVEGTTRLHQLLAALHCAHNMTAEGAGRGLLPLGQRPMLLVTDHNILRKWVAEGELANVVTPPLNVVHSRSKDATSEDVMASWVDMMLLSRASCLITCHSGFSWAALFMSSTSCWMELRTCLHTQRLRFKGFDVRRLRALL